MPWATSTAGTVRDFVLYRLTIVLEAIAEHKQTANAALGGSFVSDTVLSLESLKLIPTIL